MPKPYNNSKRSRPSSPSPDPKRRRLIPTSNTDAALFLNNVARRAFPSSPVEGDDFDEAPAMDFEDFILDGKAERIPMAHARSSRPPPLMIEDEYPFTPLPSRTRWKRSWVNSPDNKKKKLKKSTKGNRYTKENSVKNIRKCSVPVRKEAVYDCTSCISCHCVRPELRCNCPKKMVCVQYQPGDIKCTHKKRRV